MSVRYEKNEMDAESRALLDQMNSLGLPAIPSMPIEDARKLMDSFAWQSTIQLQKIEDLSIDGPYGQIPIRLYVPHGKGPLPTIVYYHGGGWVLGSIYHKDSVCRYLSEQAEAVVVSVEYRRAPEFKFPKPLEECYQAFIWTKENIKTFGGDADDITIAGDSCGANLAAGVTLLARDQKGPKIARQILICPVTDHNFETRSYKAFAKRYFVEREDMIWFWNKYLNSSDEGKNPYASPLQDKGDSSKLPPALIILAEFDTLYDEGLAYAKKLQAANVPVKLLSYPTFHGFTDLFNQLRLGREALDEVAKQI